MSNIDDDLGNSGPDDEDDLDLDRTGLPAEGEHVCVVDDVRQSFSKAGNKMLTYTLSIVEGPSKGDYLTLMLVLTEKTRWRTEQFLDAVNAPKTGKASPKSFLGTPIIAVVKHEEYDGQKQARVQKVKKHASLATEQELEEAPF